jgi:hypothetical protein
VSSIDQTDHHIMNITSVPKAAMISSLGSSYDAVLEHLRKFIYNEKSTTSEIIPIVLMFAIFWFVTFYILKDILRKLVHNKQWLVEAIERDYERSGKKMFQDLVINMTKEEAIQWFLNDWPRMQCIYLQHLAGSLFCIPALLGVLDPQISASLACLGVLSEMGWEVQDLAEILFVRALFKNGRQIWPDSILVVFLVHHSLTMVLGVPMILFYRTNRALHWLCFDLQFAGFLALALAEYTKMLNIEDPKQLRRFKIANFVALVTMIWTRVFHWVYLCIQLFVTWYNDKAWTFPFFGAILSIGFTAFSVLACVKPLFKKFIKFLHVSAEYEAIERDLDASVEMRRASMYNLEQAVADLLEYNETTELTDFVESMFATRQVSRRHTVNISGGKTAPQSVVGRRKRHSLMMAKEFAEKMKHM